MGGERLEACPALQAASPLEWKQARAFHHALPFGGSVKMRTPPPLPPTQEFNVDFIFEDSLFLNAHWRMRYDKRNDDPGD